MHLVSSAGILPLLAVGLVLWLLIMFGLGLADWLTRRPRELILRHPAKSTQNR